MVTGVGTDIVEVERIAEKIGRERGFRELVFSAAEISYCESNTNRYQHYAARFAAKEAFFKAMGTGWTEGTAFNEVEVTHDENGKPVITFTGATAATVQQKGIGRVLVSLSHITALATAVVIIET